MDPFSITTGCLGLVSSITKVCVTLNAFIREIRDARGDIDAVTREMHSLQTVLELLAEDAEPSDPTDPATTTIPANFRKQISGIVSNCTQVVEDIESCIKQHEGSKITKRIHWASSGKGDMAKLRSTLEAHKTSLNLVLDMVSLSAMRDIQDTSHATKNDTTMLLDGTKDIKEDTSRILDAIAELQARLPSNFAINPRFFMLQRYLDELTTYAESIIDPEALAERAEEVDAQSDRSSLAPNPEEMYDREPEGVAEPRRLSDSHADPRAATEVIPVETLERASDRLRDLGENAAGTIDHRIDAEGTMGSPPPSAAIPRSTIAKETATQERIEPKNVEPAPTGNATPEMERVANPAEPSKHSPTVTAISATQPPISYSRTSSVTLTENTNNSASLPVEIKTEPPKMSDSLEEQMFKMRAKLFLFNKEARQWKERGTGDVRILKHKESQKSRLVMRRAKTLAVIANHCVTPDMKLSPNVGSDRSWVWTTVADVSFSEPGTHTFAIRFANAENANLFLTAFTQAQKNNEKLLDLPVD